MYARMHLKTRTYALKITKYALLKIEKKKKKAILIQLHIRDFI